MADKDLSYAEVWDDSALQDSWNAALEEYKKYHSLARKGEKVKLNSSPPRKEPLANGEAAPKTAARVEESTEPATDLPTSDQIMEEARRSDVPTSAGAMGPLAMLSNVQNEDLKNLMMSWYYAGYYTGLYEGKQQGYVSSNQCETG